MNITIVQCGLDYGDCLFPSENEFFRNIVNVASKLGEDMATNRQILITKNFAREIRSKYKKLKKKEKASIEIVEL